MEPDSHNPDAIAARLRDTLQRSTAFQSLSPGERHGMADDLRQVLGYLTDPAAGDPSLRQPSQARKVADVATALTDPAAGEKAGQGPARMTSGQAVEQAPEAFRNLVDKVDFPDFVSKLIEGVFTSIVQSSIRQMEAYREMLESVVKSVSEFANERIPDVEARSSLMTMAGGLLQMNADGRLEEAPDADDEAFKDKLGFVPDLSTEANEKQLVNRAKIKLARQKQKLLATVVLMGINRIVVTNGRINAKVVFEVKASEAASHKGKAGSVDKSIHGDIAKDQGNQAFSDAKRALRYFSKAKDASVSISTLKKTTDEESNERIQAKAKLSGDVKINFKSETFPLERFSPESLTQVMGTAQQAPTATPPPAEWPAAAPGES